MGQPFGTGVILALVAAGAASLGSPPPFDFGGPILIGMDLASGPDLSFATDIGVGKPLLPSLRHMAGRSPHKRRSRGSQAKPRRKPNRLTSSRRVRRKHRRAA